MKKDIIQDKILVQEIYMEIIKIKESITIINSNWIHSALLYQEIKTDPWVEMFQQIKRKIQQNWTITIRIKI